MGLAPPGFGFRVGAHKVALVCADTVEWPLLMDVTADFIYCRLHGSQELYVSGYDDEALDVWARRVRAWARGGRDVYVYFDNDSKVRAPADAAGLMERRNEIGGASCWGRGCKGGEIMV